MSTMVNIRENVIIDSWVKHFSRAPDQVNKAHETDAELIEIQGNPDHYLATTIDTVAEEIAVGLYQDPYTMGWVIIMASLSDLAAVGARPLGLIISTSVESSRDDAFVSRLARGMEDACRAAGTFVLGGDTNATSTISLTCCALGLVLRDKVMTRVGCRPGDTVFITSGVGTGNALGLVKLGGYPDNLFPESIYRPVARLKEAYIIQKYATCCMDTSDGLLTTLDQLMRLNGLGFSVDCNWSTILAPHVLDFCDRIGTPHWLMTAGPHGEFELVFTVPSEHVDQFLTDSQGSGFQPIRLGTVGSSPDISLNLDSGRTIRVDMAPLRNLLYTVNGDVQRFLNEFKTFGSKWGIE
jgi:thiamine-monophosphate kinase